MDKSLFPPSSGRATKSSLCSLNASPQQITVHLRRRRYEHVKEADRTDLSALARVQEVYREHESVLRIESLHSHRRTLPPRLQVRGQ